MVEKLPQRRDSLSERASAFATITDRDIPGLLATCAAGSAS
jgi:hypothetical protein